MKYAWGTLENGDYFLTFDEIPSHVCTEEELGIIGDNNLFMPMSESEISLVK